MIRMIGPMVRMDTILELKEAVEGMQLVVMTVLSTSKMTLWRMLLDVNLDLIYKREFKPLQRKNQHQD